MGTQTLAFLFLLCSSQAIAGTSVPQQWAQRDQPGVAEGAIEQLSQAVQVQPESYELRWQLARFHYWLSSIPEGEGSLGHAETGWQHAQEAIALRPSSVEGHYWSAACAGSWAEQVPLPKAISLELPEKIELSAETAVQLDPHHDGGGPLRVLGAYHAHLPWPFRDLEKARILLEQALEQYPESPANLYFLADVSLRDGDSVRAGELLATMESTLAAATDAPRARRYAQMAGELGD